MLELSETCDKCGFDATEWDEFDTIRTLRNSPALMDLWTDGMAHDARNRRPDESTWSVNEYADHLRETFFGLRLLSEVARTDHGADLGPGIEPSPPGDPRRFEDEDVRAGFAAEAGALMRLLNGLEQDDWQHHAVIGGEPRSINWAARHAVHDFWHHLTDVARIRIALDDPPPPQVGTVAQINVSGGGVPKQPVDRAEVGRRGIEGDSQNARAHHGAPWQALCLWSSEVIDALADEGHPIAPGSAGENLTIEGYDWSAIRAGTILEIGEASCQISAIAVPCAKNNQWFSDGDSSRIHHDRHPGWSRWYASILTAGEVRPGDRVATQA